jgi:hypothetical protein
VAQSKQLGRPRIDAALERPIQMLKVARECGVGSGTVQFLQRLPNVPGLIWKT